MLYGTSLNRVSYGVVWYIVRYGMVWYGIWYGMVYGMISYMVINTSDKKYKWFISQLMWYTTLCNVTVMIPS